MVCNDEQKLLFGTHMLSEEADYLWDNAYQQLGARGTEIIWENFKKDFMEKYFSADVRIKKEIKFLQLKQGSMYVADYAAKFEEFVRFCPYFNGVEDEGSKCVKFESGLHPEIKQFIGY